MNPERAETYLRLHAEAELRRAMAQPADRPLRDGCVARVARVAQALIAVGALGRERAELIIDDYELSIDTRVADVPGPRGPRALFALQSAVARKRAAMLLHSPRWGPRMHAAVAPGALAGQAPPSPTGTRTPERAAPVGQFVRIGDDGELYLLSYLRTVSGAMFAIFARAFRDAGNPVLHQLTATDDRGIAYSLGFSGGGGGPGEWWTGALVLHPSPSHDLRWLDLVTVPGASAVRVGLSRPPQAAEVTARGASLSPGEHLLHGIAARLLATAQLFPQDIRPGLAAPRTGRLFGLVDGLSEIIAALHEAGALSPLSPVPGQLATLCASLDVTGHGIAAPPTARLPEPWLSMLAHYHRRKPPRTPPVRDGWAALAAMLPELDGIRLTVLGLHNSDGGTTLHVHGVGLPAAALGWPRELDVSPVIWIHGSDGRWHATRVGGWNAAGSGEATLRLEVVPPLSRSAAWIEVLAAGQSGEVRVTLPLRWE